MEQFSHEKDDMQRMIDEIVASEGWAMIYHRRDSILYCDYQTCGLPEVYSHPNLQIVLPLSMEQARQMLMALIHYIQMGVLFEPGNEYVDILEGHSLRVSQHRNEGENVLRVIVSDETRKFPEHPECDPVYAYQENKFSYVCGCVYRGSQIIDRF